MKLQQLFENQMAPIPVYRGMRLEKTVKEGDVIPITIRQDRKPADTSIFPSALFNRGIELMFGIPEIRKRACFGSTNKRTADNYAFQVLDYGYGDHAGTVQLLVPADTDIVYHPRVEDSMDFMGAYDAFEMMRQVYREENPELAATENDGFWSKLNKIRVNTYTSKTATDFWLHCVKAVIKDKTKYPALMAEFDRLALDFMEGYQHAKASAFPKVGGIECLIVGITECQAKVLDVCEDD